MIYHILVEKIPNIFSHFSGWILAILTAVITFFAGHKLMLELVLLSVVMDMLWGIIVSVKQGRFILSELGRATITKIAVYGCVMILFIGIDKLIGGEVVITATVVSTLIILVELWSSLASMTILYPHMPFLKLLRKALLGEIARKLGIEEDQVEKELNGENE